MVNACQHAHSDYAGLSWKHKFINWSVVWQTNYDNFSNKKAKYSLVTASKGVWSDSGRKTLAGHWGALPLCMDLYFYDNNILTTHQPPSPPLHHGLHCTFDFLFFYSVYHLLCFPLEVAAQKKALCNAFWHDGARCVGGHSYLKHSLWKSIQNCWDILHEMWRWHNRTSVGISKVIIEELWMYPVEIFHKLDEKTRNHKVAFPAQTRTDLHRTFIDKDRIPFPFIEPHDEHGSKSTSVQTV